MKNERIKELRKELKYLLEEEIEIELKKNEEKINDIKINIKDLSKDIYLERGLNINKIQKNHLGNLIDNFTEMIDLFKSKEKLTKRAMIVDVIYMVLIIMFVKIPFDLVQDIGYEFIDILSNNLLSKIWDLIFALLYLIIVVCILLVAIKSFNKKFKNAK